MTNKGFSLIGVIAMIGLLGGVTYTVKTIIYELRNEDDIERLEKQIVQLKKERDSSHLGKELNKCVGKLAKERSNDSKELAKCLSNQGKVHQEIQKKLTKCKQDLGQKDRRWKRKVEGIETRCEQKRLEDRRTFGFAVSDRIRRYKELQAKYDKTWKLLKKKCKQK